MSRNGPKLVPMCQRGDYTCQHLQMGMSSADYTCLKMERRKHFGWQEPYVVRPNVFAPKECPLKEPHHG